MVNLPIQIEDLVENLFQNSSFISKLRMFYEVECLESKESIRTEVSLERLEQSHSGYTLDADIVSSQIEDILLELCNKNCEGKGTDLCFSNLNQEQLISDIKEQIESISHTVHLHSLNLSHLLAQQERLPQYVTIQQHQTWEEEVLEKLDISGKRNLCTAQSLFADQLNSFQMDLINKIEWHETCNEKPLRNSKKSITKKQENKVMDKEIKTEKESKRIIQANQSESLDLVKKLKNVKSLGNLFGMKV